MDYFGCRVRTVHGIWAILDRDLAERLGVSTRNLNRSTRRNLARFPPSSIFQLDRETTLAFRPGRGRGGPWKHPLAYTEHAAIIASHCFKTPAALAIRQITAKRLAALQAFRRPAPPKHPVAQWLEARWLSVWASIDD
jgi:hypothetical protein